MGVSTPNDISIVGYNDEVILSEFCDPTLTTIRQLNKLMGSTSMNLLIDIIEGERIKSKNIILPTELIIRNSTKKIGD